MKKSRKMVGSVVIILGIMAILISFYCFWNAYRIRE